MAEAGCTPTLPQKRKRSVLALGKKMEIVCELQNGHSQRTVAVNYGVMKSMVGDIWKYRQSSRIAFHQASPVVCKKVLRCVSQNTI